MQSDRTASSLAGGPAAATIVPEYDDNIVKMFFTATVVWALVGMLVGVIIALQLAWWPANLGTPWTTFGRLRPLHTNAVIFAFAGNVVFTGIYHSTQRLLKTRMFNDTLSRIHFWGWQGIIVAAAKQLQGKALSYNNIADSDAALECVRQFAEPACVIVKHANPCGVAVADSIGAAYERAFSTDPTSAFGGIIAFNRPLDAATARAIIERQFVEVIVAPQIEATAAEITAAKKNVRVLETGAWPDAPVAGYDFKKVSGGLLVQNTDLGVITADDLKVVTDKAPTPEQVQDMLFAWTVVKYVKSNAIIFCKDHMTIGIGAGQMSRVYSTKIAAIKAADEGLAVKGSVMASDAFFPFRDGIDAAAEHGIAAIIQPGGSMRDDEVIQAANEHGLAMVFTGMRHFRH